VKERRPQLGGGGAGRLQLILGRGEAAVLVLRHKVVLTGKGGGMVMLLQLMVVRVVL
jgi:hypothetical protein